MDKNTIIKTRKYKIKKTIGGAKVPIPPETIETPIQDTIKSYKSETIEPTVLPKDIIQTSIEKRKHQIKKPIITEDKIMNTKLITLDLGDIGFSYYEHKVVLPDLPSTTYYNTETFDDYN